MPSNEGDGCGKNKQTTPTGHEIPVPKREDVLGNLKKVAKPVEEKESADGEAREE